ncbi:MAG: DNA gyrase inhibitor YacG [bacterium]
MKRSGAKSCPYCGKPAPWENNPFRPFCSGRCRLIDLGNWASEKYRVPSSQPPDGSSADEWGDSVPPDGKEGE